MEGVDVNRSGFARTTSHRKAHLVIHHDAAPPAFNVDRALCTRAQRLRQLRLPPVRLVLLYGERLRRWLLHLPKECRMSGCELVSRKTSRRDGSADWDLRSVVEV